MTLQRRFRLVPLPITPCAILLLPLLHGCPGIIPSDRSDLSSIPNTLTLQAAEAKRYQFLAQDGDTVVINSTVPDSASDVDLFVYDPNEELISSSTNDAGLPDNVRFRIQETGTHALDVVNISPTRLVTCTLATQVLPGASASRSNLNGLYRFVEIDSFPVPDAVQRKWLFADGDLVSRYIFLEQGAFDLPSDFEVWISAIPGRSTEMHLLDVDIVIRTRLSNTTVFGNTVALEIAIETTFAEASVGTFSTQSAALLDGSLSGEGRVFQGDFCEDHTVAGVTSTSCGTFRMVRE